MKVALKAGLIYYGKRTVLSKLSAVEESFITDNLDIAERNNMKRTHEIIARNDSSPSLRQLF